MKNTSTFKSKHSDEVYQIKKKINCNSKMAVYLIECRVCGKQYKGSIATKFRARANNYKMIIHIDIIFSIYLMFFYLYLEHFFIIVITIIIFYYYHI